MTNATEIALDTASAAMNAARAALKRNRKSAAAQNAFLIASQVWEEAFNAHRAALDNAERDELRARRLAFVAPRRALLARQMAFSF